MLRKIIRVENVGRLKNCNSVGTGTNDAQFQTNTVLFGTNGDGKSTFCSILRSLTGGDPGYVMGRKTLGQEEDPKIELRFESGNARFDGGVWSGVSPRIAIYDDTFIEENIFSGNAIDVVQRRGLFRVIIGKKGVEIAEREAALTQFVKDLKALCKSKEREIIPGLPEDVDLETFLGLEKNDEIDREIEDQFRTHEAAKQAATVVAQAGFQAINLPASPENLTAVLGKTLEEVEKDAENRIVAHIEKHKMGGSGNDWLETGTVYIEDDKCPFCTQDVKDNKQIAAYKAVFGDAYNALKSDVASILTMMRDSFGPGSVSAISIAIERNKTAQEYWRKFVDLDIGALALPEGFMDGLEIIHDQAIAALEEKLAAPLEEMVVAEDLETALHTYNTQTIEVARVYNEAVAVANTLIDTAKQAVGNNDIAAEYLKLNILLATKLRHEPDMIVKCDELLALRGSLREAEEDKTAARKELEEYTAEEMPKFEKRINELLDDFNATFRLAQTTHNFAGGQPSTTYELSINGENVGLGSARTPKEERSFKNTLSAGDKSTLALACFLVGVERDVDKQDTIVVFDDPFTSQDRFRRSNTIYEIRRIALDVKQVIILSHDESFLKAYWEKCDSSRRNSLKFHSQGEAAGSVLMGCDIEELCMARIETERQKLLAFFHENVGNPYDIVQKMRVVLETHFKATFPEDFGQQQWLGDICGKIRDDGDAGSAWCHYDALDRVNDYSSKYHHGDDPTQIDHSIPIDPGELKGFVKKTLKILNAL